MARRRKNRPLRKLKERYLIIVDGENEKWYLETIKRHRRLDKFSFKPEIGKVDAVQIQEILADLEVYNKIFWIIDFDVILKEKREHTASSKKSYKTKLDLIRENLGKYQNLEILINNPCLEVWFLMHFVFKNPQYRNCQQVINELKRYIPTYTKSRKFYVDSYPDIYLRLKDKLGKAIENAERLGHFDWENTNKTLAEIYRLIKLILAYSDER